MNNQTNNSEIITDSDVLDTAFDMSEAKTPKAETSFQTTEDVIDAMDYYTEITKDERQNLKTKARADVDLAALDSTKYLTNAAGQANKAFFDNKYLSSQTVDKAGWSGGYALDTEKQLAFLRSSIQADIYNQYELQKMGYKSQLTSAMEAAELQADELALQRYQTALQNAATKAELTGYYIDPHFDDMLTQYTMANKILSNDNATEDEIARATRIRDFVFKQFNNAAKQGYKVEFGEGPEGGEAVPGSTISYQGIETMAKIAADAQAKYNIAYAEAMEAEALLDKITIAQAIEETKGKDGNYLPYFTEDGTLAGYGNTLPTSDKQKEALKNWFDANPDSKEKALTKIFNEMVTEWSTKDKQEKDKGNKNGYDWNKFLNEYNGTTINALMDILDGEDKEDGSNKKEYVINDDIKIVWDGKRYRFEATKETAKKTAPTTATKTEASTDVKSYATFSDLTKDTYADNITNNRGYINRDILKAYLSEVEKTKYLLEGHTTLLNDNYAIALEKGRDTVETDKRFTIKRIVKNETSTGFALEPVKDLASYEKNGTILQASTGWWYGYIMYYNGKWYEIEKV